MRQIRLFPRPNAAEKVVLRLLPVTEDRSFLPPAMSLVETPPSPIRIALMLSICLFATAALTWSWFGRIDVIAVARGEIEPAGHNKVVQPLDNSRVLDIAVSEGQAVKAGDVLIRLDPRDIEADLQGATRAEVSARAEAIRRQTAIAMIMEGCWTCAMVPDWTDDIPREIRLREEEVLRGDIREVAATVANLANQKSEKKAAVEQIALSIAAQQRLIATLNQRVDMRNLAQEKNVGSKSNLLDAMQTLREAEAQLANDIGKADIAKAALSSVDSEKDKTIQGFLADQTRKMADAGRTAAQKVSERDKLQTRVEQMMLRAPVDGVVQNLTVTTVGQIVTVGQELLRIVPNQTRLSIQAYISNEDVAFIARDQQAIVKVDAFPFTRYGTMAARVTGISRDSIPADTANEAMMDSSRASDRAARSITPTAKPMTDLVYGIDLDLEGDGIQSNGRTIPFSPGMTVSVEIKTGSRRILDYLFSPLVEITGNALHER